MDHGLVEDYDDDVYHYLPYLVGFAEDADGRWLYEGDIQTVSNEGDRGPRQHPNSFTFSENGRDAPNRTLVAP